MNANQINIALLISIITFSSCHTNKDYFSNEKVNYFPVGKNGKWGYTDANGDLTIDYKFESVTFFSGDRAAVKLNGKYGFINKHGEFIGKPKYDTIGYFTATRANVTKRGKRLTIDRKGKKLKEGIIISTGGNAMPNANPLDYFEVIDNKYLLNKKDFENEQRLDPVAELGIMDFTFDEVLPFSWNSFIVVKSNKYDIFLLNAGGLINLWVEVIEPIRRDWSNVNSSQYARFKKEGKWGLISNSGKILIEPEFYNFKNAHGQYYLVEYQPNYWGYISQAKRLFRE